LGESDEEQWQRRLKELEEKAKSLPETEIPGFNEKRFKEIFGEMEEKEEEKREMAERIKDYETRIHQLGVKTLDDLVELKENKQQRIGEIDKTFESGRVVVEILEGLLGTQEDFLDSIFTDKEASISKTFKELTGGRYQEARLEGNNIKLITQGGKELSSSFLRGSGVSDQLYLSIRFALAERLLKDKGFLLLDEPFLRFDRVERLERGLDLLLRMVQVGWQVFYFTLEPLVVDIIRKKCAKEDLLVKDLKQLEV